MREIAQRYQDKLPDLKRKVEESYGYFEENYRLYNKFKKFVYDTTMSADDVSKLIVLKRPNVEFNILEAFINRRIGEFTQHEPILQVRAADGLMKSQITDDLLKTIDVIEGHIREIFDSATNDGLQTNLYKDTMAGGFSVAEIGTEYISDMSFEQRIRVERVFDPCLCGFDPMARESHKGDGQYCFKIIPRTKEDFEEEFGRDACKDMSFARNLDSGNFSWSYKNEKQSILLEVWFYLKEQKDEVIAKLSNGSVILKKHYDQLVNYWHNVMHKLEQPPIIVETRNTMVECIWEYRFCENKIYSAKETNWRYLPLVFVDGNSVVIKRSKEDSTYQMTKPYVYQAEGVQRLKNFAGQTLASELETMIQHKFIVSLEAIPADYVGAYTNPQTAQVLAYNAFYEKNPNMPLPPPQVIQRSEVPRVVIETFEGTDRTTQTILGSFDAQMGVVGDKISGRAIEKGAIQSDAAAMPYLENFIKGMNRIGQILLDLIPKYYLTPRSIPVRKANGLRSYQIINDPSDPSSIDINYDPNALQIKIEAGVNSTMQKQYALAQITSLMGASELFAQFINSEGLDLLVDNLDIKGIEELKIRAEQFVQKMKSQPPKPDPMQQAIQVEAQKVQNQVMIEGAKIQQRAAEAEMKQAQEIAGRAIDEKKADIEYIKALADLDEKQRRMLAAETKQDSEMARDAISLALDVAAHHHEVALSQQQNEAAITQQQQPIQNE